MGDRPLAPPGMCTKYERHLLEVCTSTAPVGRVPGLAIPWGGQICWASWNRRPGRPGMEKTPGAVPGNGGEIPAPRGQDWASRRSQSGKDHAKGLRVTWVAVAPGSAGAPAGIKNVEPARAPALPGDMQSFSGGTPCAVFPRSGRHAEDLRRDDPSPPALSSGRPDPAPANTGSVTAYGQSTSGAVGGTHLGADRCPAGCGH